jgi:organic radical activating enzyme
MPDQYIEKNDGYRHHKMDEGLLAGWNSQYMKNIRLAMLNGKKLRECEKCYEKEAKGLPSLRINSNSHRNIERFRSMTNADGSLDVMPYDIELHFGNVCNLRCKMCSTFFSHMIGKELLSIKNDDPKFFNWIQRQGGHVNNWSTGDLSAIYDWYKDKSVKEKIFNQINEHVDRIQIIGGEPTIIPEFWELMEFLHSKGTLKNKKIKLTTNGTNTNPRLIKWFSEAKKIEVMVSIDALENRNKYIRFPADWDTLLKNLERYKELCETRTEAVYYIAPSPQILNIDQLTEMCLFFQELGHPISINPKVTGPTICDYQYFPLDYKQKVKQKLKLNLDLVKNDKNRSLIETYINSLDVDYEDKDFMKITLRSFVKYNDYMDKHRNTDSWRKLLPDLEQSIENNL